MNRKSNRLRLATRLFFMKTAEHRKQKMVLLSLEGRKLGEDIEPSRQLGTAETAVGS
jgi:hypothetical protein